MILTDGQSRALDAVSSIGKSHKNGGGVVVINGPAGSGKSSLLKVIAKDNPDIVVLAPTGKAATRVRALSGCKVSTIHKFLYRAEEDKFGDLVFSRKDLIDIDTPNFHSIIVDEASMVSEEIWDDLYDTCCLLELNVVLIGDSFQLPPVVGKDTAQFSVFSPEFECDIKVELDEILRQALDSPILAAANAIRLGKDYPKHLSYLPVIMKDGFIERCTQTFKDSGIILCHTNEMRHKINNAIRDELGRFSAVEEGEPVLVIKNNYDLDIFNGEIFRVEKVVAKVGSKLVKDKFKHISANIDFMLIELENGQRAVIAAQQLSNKIGEMSHKIIEKECAKLLKKSHLDETPFLHTNYGYACSVHRFQGSECDEGIVLMESTIRLQTIQGRKWTYTALTRFKKNVSICWE